MSHRPEDLKMTNRIDDWTLALELFKIVFALYLLVTAIVLVNISLSFFHHHLYSGKSSYCLSLASL